MKRSVMFVVLHRLVLWLFRRSEWVEIGERKIGRRRMAFDCPNSPMSDLIEKTWRHPCGYIMRNRWLR